MGLDIYLYRYDNREETEKLETIFEEAEQKNWDKLGSYDSLTDEQKETVRTENKALAVSMGLTEGGDDPRKQKIENDHPKYKDHYFKIGYFRSSYNGGGINRIMANFGLPGLYEIFGRDRDEDYIFAPDWILSLARVTDAIEQLKQRGNYRCFEVDANEFSSKELPSSEEDALALAITNISKDRVMDGGFSNIDGHFFPSGIKVFALIPGNKKSLFAALHGVPGQRPTTYVISEGENEWYIQALEIVRDTIQFVLDQPDKDKYFLHWSS